MCSRAFRYRAYLTDDQFVLAMKTVGSCRFVYNDALNYKTTEYRISGKFCQLQQAFRQTYATEETILLAEGGRFDRPAAVPAPPGYGFQELLPEKEGGQVSRI